MAWDYLYANDYSNTIQLEADSTPPTIEESPPEYKSTADVSKLDLVVNYNISDSQSGVYSVLYSFDNDLGETVVEEEALSGTDGVYSFTPTDMTRDMKYSYTLGATDRVTNEDSLSGFFGLTRGPAFSGEGPERSQSEGRHKMVFNLDAGRYFNDDAIGYRSLSVKLDDRSLYSLDEAAINSLDRFGDPLDYEWDQIHQISFDTVLPLSSDYAHKAYLLSLEGEYQNGFVESTEAYSPYYLELPNITFDEVNDFSLKFYRDGDVIEDFNYSDLHGKTESLFYIDSFQLQLDGVEGNGKDLEGDLLYLQITTPDKTVTVPASEGRISFDAENGTISTEERGVLVSDIILDEISAVSIVEEFDREYFDGDEKKTEEDSREEFALDLSIRKDTDFYAELIHIDLDSSDTEGHQWEQILSTNDGSFKWHVTYGTDTEDFTDTSGIQYVSFFEYDQGITNFTLADYKALDASHVVTKEFQVGEDYQIDTEESFFHLREQTEGEASLRRMGVYIQDFAGHYTIATQEAYYDLSPPPALDPDGGVVQWFGEEESPENLSYQGFSRTENVITLKLDLAEELYGDLEGCTIEAGAGADFPVSVELAGQDFLTITIPSDFPSDSPIDLGLLFTDYAGNSTENLMRLYTPVYFDRPYTDYIVETDAEWDDQGEAPLGHYLAWEQIGLTGDELVLHDTVNGESYGAVEGFGDLVRPGLTAHDERDYLLRARNRSGYESSFSTREEEGISTGLRFSRKLLNNSPFVTVYEESGTYSAGGGEEYLGPLNHLTVHFADYDETDDFVLKYFVNGEFYKEQGVSGTLGAGGLQHEMSVQDFFSDFLDGEVYEIRYEILDHWQSDGAVEEGTIVLNDPVSYTYDAVSPDLAVFQYDKRDGFSYIYGDIHLHILDEGSGLVSRTLYESVDSGIAEPTNGTALSDGDETEGFTHLISGIPDITDYTLQVRMEDGVGNYRTETIGPFSKDSVSPVLEGAEVAVEENLFSRPSVPVQASWRDNLSGAARLLYQFTDGEAVLKEGETAASGDLLGLLSGEWLVYCSLSESLLEDKEYTLRVKLLDNAGNGEEADWTRLADDITIDQSLPVLVLTGQTGWAFNKGQYYLNPQVSPELQYDVTDNSPSGSVWYELERGEEVSSSPSLADLLTGLEEGEEYALRVWTEDRAGNQGASSPFVFYTDSTAPDASRFSLTIPDQKSSYEQGEQLRFTFDARDEHSGIDRFALWVGRTVDGADVPVISSLLPGHLADGTVVMDYVEGKTYSINLPEAEAGSYFFKASAVDFAGNESALTMLGGQALGVTTSTERLVVQDFDVYHNDPSQLRGWWKYEGEKEFNHYAYRVIEKTSGQAVSDWAYTFKQYGAASFPSGLEEGQIYYFEVYAGFGDGSRSASRYSPGALIDLSEPEVTAVSLPSYGTPADLKLSWESVDAVSAVGQVQVRLETYRTDENGEILTEVFEENGADLRVPVREELGTFTLGQGGSGENVQVLQAEDYEGLSLQDGQRLLLTLRVSDLAGNVTETYCGLFIKDSSAPPVPVVLDGGDFINPLKNPVRVDWSWSREDPHSGKASYFYQPLLPGESPDPEGWVAVDTPYAELSGLGDRYENGSEMTVAVKVVNGAGLSSVGYSNGIVLDQTKPARAEAALLGPEGEETSYLLGRNANLRMFSEDDQSGISSYRYEPGLFEGTDWVPLTEGYEEVLAGDESIPVVIPEELESPGVVYYKVTAFNPAGDLSLPGYTAGAKLYDGVPLITDLTGDAVSGDLQFFWDADDTVPLTDITLKLKKSGLVVQTVPVGGDLRDYLFKDVPDGLYELQIDYLAANSSSDGETVLSPVVSVDTTPPVISDLAYSHFVNDLFDYNFVIRDNLTGGKGYRFRIGPTGAPDLLTEGWVWTGSTGSYQEETLSFLEDFAGGYDSLEDGGTILFSCQAQDWAGNWSDMATSIPILVDRTAPETPVVDLNRDITLDDGTLYTQEGRFVTESDRISPVIIEGLDPESGITGYRWAVLKKDSEEEPLWSPTVSYQAEEGDFRISLRDAVLSGAVLEEGEEYIVSVRTVNGSGLFSEAGSSPVLLADLSAPVFEVDTLSSGLDREETAQGIRLIYNSGGDLSIRILEEAGEVLKLTYSLIDPDGAEGGEVSAYYLGPDSADMTLPFTPTDLTAYGSYRMRIALRDAGGYESVLYQDIRLNSPPAFALQDVTSNPMKPFDLPLSDWVSDQDQVVNTVIQIAHNGEVDEWNQELIGDLTGLALDHEELFAGKTSYTYTVTAEDQYGVSASSEGTITIVNTTEGTLYTDEYWLGEHQVTGSILVPAGLKLSLAEGTTVEIVTGEEKKDIVLTIAAGAQLDHLGSAVYQAFDPSLGIPWKGLLIEGGADLSHITVQGADRGVILKSPDVPDITGSVFRDNTIGLHLLGSSPDISGCTFEDNTYYGIKEDDGSQPALTDNLFRGNGYDYYDLDRTVLDAQELNALEGNSGNRGDNSL